MEHLCEFRRTLLQCLGVFGLAVAIVIPLTPSLLTALKWPLQGIVADPDSFLTSYEVASGFVVMLRIAAGGGLLLAAPWIALLVGRFIMPGLTLAERRLVRRYSGLAVMLFGVGVVFAYGLILPLALRVMLRIHQWMGIHVVHVLATNYIAFVIQMMLGFGLAFEMPVALLILGHLGIVDAVLLRSRRRQVWVAMLIVAMLMTPQDVATQLLMAGPLIAMYEGCILLIGRRSPSSWDVDDMLK